MISIRIDDNLQMIAIYQHTHTIAKKKKKKSGIILFSLAFANIYTQLYWKSLMNEAQYL